MTSIAKNSPRKNSRRMDADDWLVRGLLLLLGACFVFALVVPLSMLVMRSLQDRDGNFIGLENYITYFSTPALSNSISNSFFIASLGAFIVIVLAFTYAFALTRTCMPYKTFFKVMALVPLLSPSLVKAIALVYWFGNQGVLKDALFGYSIYGPIGIVIASVFWTFPHAVLIISISLALSDGRLFEAAEALKTSKLRTFLTVTIPSARFGTISAAFVVFILIFTDFGVPKIIGGNYNVLATDIYKEVVGQQNFGMGAVVSVILLIPAAIAFVIDRLSARKQAAMITARSVPYEPKPNPMVDYSMLAFCSFITICTLGIIGMTQYAAIIKFWPYNLEFTLQSYTFDFEGVGWENFANSLTASFWVSIIGTSIIFLGAYLVEKPRGDGATRQLIQFFALMPMAIPGLVLGLAYLFFINHPANPFGFLYGTIAIIVINTITHFYTVAHLTAVTALKQLDAEFEAVSASMKVPMRKSFFRITVPICLPAILDIALYLFLTSMTTVAAVIFLYGPHTKMASVAAIHMEEMGEIGAAAAMSMLIVYTCLAVRLLHVLIAGKLFTRFQSWRVRSSEKQS